MSASNLHQELPLLVSQFNLGSPKVSNKPLKTSHNSLFTLKWLRINTGMHVLQWLDLFWMCFILKSLNLRTFGGGGGGGRKSGTCVYHRNSLKRMRHISSFVQYIFYYRRTE